LICPGAAGAVGASPSTALSNGVTSPMNGAEIMARIASPARTEPMLFSAVIEPSIEPRASTLPIVPHASMVADVLVPSGAGGGGVQLPPAEMLALIDP
jgi:hypothetical protein